MLLKSLLTLRRRHVPQIDDRQFKRLCRLDSLHGLPIVHHDRGAYNGVALHKRIQSVEHQLLPRVVDWIGKGALELGPPARVTRPVNADAPPRVAPELR